MNTHSSIERLEPRIAPAAVITTDLARKTDTWTDFDGDTVTLKWTKNHTGGYVTVDSGLGLIVEKINLSAFLNTDDSFTITVKAGPLGDGRVAIGRINATGVPLKSWSSPAASISEFDCGDGVKGIGTLVIGTLGESRVADYPGADGDGVSLIDGAVSAVTIRGDVGATSLKIDHGGVMKSFTVAGNLRGTDPFFTTAGMVNIAGTSLGTLTIGGSVLGGNDTSEGSLITLVPVGKLTIKGSIVGGTGESTGLVLAPAKVVVIGGSVVGGEGEGSGNGQFRATAMASLTVGGSILGGKNAGGLIGLFSAGTVTIKGDIRGGLETEATGVGYIGALSANSIKTLTIGGDLVAGTYGSGTHESYNGAVIITGKLGSVTIKGSIIGNPDQEAIIIAFGLASLPVTPAHLNAIDKLTVLGSVSYGYIAAGQFAELNTYSERIGASENPDTGIGSVRVGGDWFHSSLTAGIDDVGTNGFTNQDTQTSGDPARQSILGPIVIGGHILNNPVLSVFSFSGFGAGKIVSLTAGKVKLFKSGDPGRSLDPNGVVDVAEFV